jgi:hypothetical protein
LPYLEITMPVRFLRLFSICCLLLVCSAEAAQVYMSRDINGNVVFSDQASGKAEKIEVKELPIVPAFVIPAPRTIEAAVSTKTQPDYRSLTIISPREGDTLQNGDANNLIVVADLVPALLPEDALVLYDNGELIRHSHTSHFAVNDLERGEHHIEVAVTGINGKEKIRSAAVTIYIHRASVLKNAKDQR